MWGLSSESFEQDDEDDCFDDKSLNSTHDGSHRAVNDPHHPSSPPFQESMACINGDANSDILRTPKLTRLSSFQPPTPGSVEVTLFNRLVEKNKRLNKHWEQKTLEECFPILNDVDRLLKILSDSKCRFLSELR